jgi:hypothetical protein
MISIVMISILVFPIIFLISLTVNIQIVIVGLAFALCAISAFLVMFAPKTYTLLFGTAIGHAKVTSTVEAVSGSGAAAQPSHTASSGPLAAAGRAMHGLSEDAKAAFITEQVHQWQALLLKLNEHDSQGSSKSGLSQSVSRLSEKEEGAVGMGEEHYDEAPVLPHSPSQKHAFEEKAIEKGVNEVVMF